MPYGTVNADVIQSSVANTSLGAGNASIMKNRIINGAMVIDQRNAGASVTPASDAYTLDRWVAGMSVGSKFSVQQVSTAPAGFVNSIKITSLASTSLGSGDYYTIEQPIEGYNIADLGFGTASAKTLTLSFWVQSSLTGTFGGCFRGASSTRSYPFTYTISSANTWEQKTVTFTGALDGTWLTTNGKGLSVIFGLGVGTTYSGTAGSWASSNYLSATGATSVVGTNGATFYITGVQLEVGSSATGYEYVNYQTLLSNCQRYYEIETNNGNGTNFMTGPIGGNCSSMWQLKVTKRASPTFALASGASWVNATPTAYPTNNIVTFYAAGASYFYLTGSASATICSASAEL